MVEIHVKLNQHFTSTFKVDTEGKRNAPNIENHINVMACLVGGAGVLAVLPALVVRKVKQH